MTAKVCTVCSVEKPLDAFHKHPNTRDRRQSQCKGCAQGGSRKSKYGLTPDEYDAMLARQGGGCAICGAQEQICAFFCIDHDHRTGDVRGVLCNRCNTGLGGFRDDADLLRRAAEYLAEQ